MHRASWDISGEGQVHLGRGGLLLSAVFPSCDKRSGEGPVQSFYFLTFILYWRILDLQSCISLSCIAKWFSGTCVSLVQFSRSVVSDSLRPHESQHARPPCPSPTPGVHPDSRPSSQWCHPAISSSVVPFTSCPQSLPASESFPMSQLFTWGGQSTGVSALASFLPKKS